MRALVVDDDPDVAQMTSRLLRTALDWQVRVAYDGGEALALLEVFRPQIAFLDIMMPVVDGLEVARRIRQSPQFGKIPLVAISALDGAGFEADVLAAGFDVRLVKPVSVETLARTLQRLRAPKP